MQRIPIPYSLFPIPYSLFPIPYSLFPLLSSQIRCSGDPLFPKIPKLCTS
ncbi:MULTISPECIES: hypothetical protein [unclassified Moorena]|nr:MULTISPECIES: hypothetical protein [unclassified Moorena]NEP33171.1 hypothetical protein [Moorena sp. SIO3B2]NEQ12831.1 hypothetical protein [Moorena sp. SIO3E2]NES46538.1 hypothetical protein [Moorena sp. SIO2C4]